MNKMEELLTNETKHIEQFIWIRLVRLCNWCLEGSKNVVLNYSYKNYL